ncbi:MAG: ABC transporter ATP-binding protein, partial [Rhodobacteraceae bacterium]|nr:ABC transporter ATP-binding protein [Paracoccaceae bacterium]
LDIESREALVNALTEYSGAVILVSHDMHLLGLVADRLWLVKDGAVAPYPDDLESYRRMLLAGEESEKPKEKPKARPAALSRDEKLALRADLRRCEERLAKLNEMRDKLARKLADPELYQIPGEAVVWQKKYAEVMEALDKAEALWLQAAEKLEKAEA